MSTGGDGCEDSRRHRGWPRAILGSGALAAGTRAAPSASMRKKTLDLAAQLRAIAEQPQYGNRKPNVFLLDLRFVGAGSWPAFSDVEDTVPDASNC